MRTRSIATVLVLACGLLAAPHAIAQQEADPSNAVFRLQVLDRHPGPDGFYHGHGYGTGFFIASDSTALTASHVVYLVAHDPQKYQLQAVVGKELYDATVVCSSTLPYDPSKVGPSQGVAFSRDVAEIRLAPSTMPVGHQELFYKTKDGQKIPIATAHLGPLPSFPFLTIGGSPEGQVRIIGYGGISPIPYKWTVYGQVVRDYSSRVDGTPLFDIQSSDPAVPGDSGAPVLNQANHVVGMSAWHYLIQSDQDAAEAASALAPACR